MVLVWVEVLGFGLILGFGFQFWEVGFGFFGVLFGLLFLLLLLLLLFIAFCLFACLFFPWGEMLLSSEQVQKLCALQLCSRKHSNCSLLRLHLVFASSYHFSGEKELFSGPQQ